MQKTEKNIKKWPKNRPNTDTQSAVINFPHNDSVAQQPITSDWVLVFGLNLMQKTEKKHQKIDKIRSKNDQNSQKIDIFLTKNDDPHRQKSKTA